MGAQRTQLTTQITVPTIGSFRTRETNTTGPEKSEYKDNLKETRKTIKISKWRWFKEWWYTCWQGQVRILRKVSLFQIFVYKSVKFRPPVGTKLTISFSLNAAVQTRKMKSKELPCLQLNETVSSTLRIRQLVKIEKKKWICGLNCS